MNGRLWRGNGPGSDRHLLANLAQVRNEIERRKEAAMDGEGIDGRTGACEYPDCGLTARREGLCIKHLAALVHGDEDAAAVVRKHYTLRAAADATAERKDEMHMCEKCGKSFKTKNGLSRHGGWCGKSLHDPQGGPPAATGAPSPTCAVPGCQRPRKSRGLCETHLFRIFKGKDEALRDEAMKYLLAPRHPGPGSRRRARCGEPSKAATEAPKPEANVRASDGPPDGMRREGHAFVRLAELLGWAEVLLDFPCPEGHAFFNCNNSKMAVMSADGTIKAARLVIAD
ncbi:MAG TPA: hypothetical protein VNA25_16775 [Phycisphaerae bacterium]|nr:hypothetical protein [Phycisphaerae bacterium]